MKNLFLLPTDKPSRLIHNDANQLCYQSNKSFKNDRKIRKKFNIYITSHEEIKEGDWFINSSNQLGWCNKELEVYLTTNFTKIPKHKIILTTDQQLVDDGVQAIPDDFLEWICKNPSCEEVEVADLWKEGTPSAHDSYQIIIPHEEPKQETPNKLESVLAKITHQNDLGLSQWYEVVYYDNGWYSYAGSKTFRDGEQVIEWVYCRNILN